MASETKNLVRATVNTKGSVTTVRIETDVTAKMFLGCPIVQLTDEKGVKVSPAFAVGVSKGAKAEAPTASGISFPYGADDKPLVLTYTTADNKNDIVMKLGVAIEKAEKVLAQVKANYDRVVKASKAIAIEE